jgi:allophanate hydrolase
MCPCTLYPSPVRYIDSSDKNYHVDWFDLQSECKLIFLLVLYRIDLLHSSNQLSRARHTHVARHRAAVGPPPGREQHRCQLSVDVVIEVPRYLLHEAHNLSKICDVDILITVDIISPGRFCSHSGASRSLTRVLARDMSPTAISPEPTASVQTQKLHNGTLSEAELNHDDLSIENLERLYAQNALDPVDVVRLVYKRIDEYHDKAVWITLVHKAEALEAAQELSKRYPDPAARPALFGIPFSVKDSIDVAGMPTTLACPTYAYKASQTAPVIDRILAAGGILIGKTNLDQFATGLNGTRSPYGSPRCVYDAEYISGGSSSGSAVSVGASQVSFAVATDTAGSTRVPSALNGLIGLKPTLGTISTVGLVPACKTADCITIIANTVQTTLSALRVVRSYDEDDIFARDNLQLAVLASQPSWWDPRLDSRVIRYALPPQETISLALSDTYRDLFAKVLKKLSSLDFLAEETAFDYTPFASANAMLYGGSIVSQRIAAFKEYLDSTGMDDMHPTVRDIFSASQGFDAVRAYQDIFALAEHRRKALRQFRSSSSPLLKTGLDVLIVPSTATHPTVPEMLADPLELNKRLGSFTHFVNLLDLCAVAVPVGGTWTSKSGKMMPFSITLISTPGRDEDLLKLAQRLLKENWT